MRGDEARVVAAFREYLERDGWTVESEVNFCDLVANRDGQRLYVEAKGLTTSPGLDVDTMYGQLLRRMPFDEDSKAKFVVVVPDRALTAALRVQGRVRELLRIDVYSVGEDSSVTGPHH
jgi:hypothetical protein